MLGESLADGIGAAFVLCCDVLVCHALQESRYWSMHGLISRIWDFTIGRHVTTTVLNCYCVVNLLRLVVSIIRHNKFLCMVIRVVSVGSSSACDAFSALLCMRIFDSNTAVKRDFCITCLDVMKFNPPQLNTPNENYFLCREFIDPAYWLLW